MGGIEVVVHGIVEVLRQSRNIRNLYPRLSFHLLAVLEAAQVLQAVHEASQAFLGGLQGFVAEIDGAAIVGLQDEEADGHGRVGLREQGMVAREELRQGDEVVVGLAHLLAVDGNHVVVHPVVHHLVALACDSLRYLAFVVGEDEVHAAAVDVEVLAQIFASHRRALAVPAGEAVAPRRRPAHDVLGLCRFPKGEIRLILLLAHAGKVAARILHILKVAPREDAPAVDFVVLLDVEIDAAVALVGIAVVENLPDELLLLDDMAGSMGLDAWRQAAKGVHCRVEAVRVVLRYLHRLQLFQPGFLCDFVLALVGIVLQMAHVRDVTHIAHLVADVLEVSEKEIEGDGWPGMSEMRVAINGRAADVHAHAPRVERLEEFLLPAQGVINE